MTTLLHFILSYIHLSALSRVHTLLYSSSAHLFFFKTDRLHLLRKWLQDFANRGGNPLKMPCSKSLAKYREKLVPRGLLATASMARFPLASIFQHTVERLFERPDMRDWADNLDDGATLEFLWKWGMDGQSGEQLLVSTSIYS